MIETAATNMCEGDQRSGFQRLGWRRSSCRLAAEVKFTSNGKQRFRKETNQKRRYKLYAYCQGQHFL